MPQLSNAQGNDQGNADDTASPATAEVAASGLTEEEEQELAELMDE